METKNVFSRHSELVSEFSVSSKKIGRSGTEFRMTKSYHGFTFVELIVVITILVILGTIGFMSMQGFAGSARDSARIENLGNLHKGLSLFNITSGVYPMPEGPVTITASGTDIGYQGFAKDQVAGIAKLSAGAIKDPLDATMFTTYSVNSNQTKMELMNYLENGSNITVFVPNVYASTSSDYSKRSPTLKGDTVGILLGNGTGNLNQPVQESGTGVDILNTTGSYTIQFSNTEKISGTGTMLMAGIAGGGLISYWNFNENIGTIAYDKKGNNNLTLSGGFSFSGGVSGSSLFLDGLNGQASNSGLVGLGKGNAPHTVSAWVKPYNTCTEIVVNECRQWLLLIGGPVAGSHHWLLYSKTNTPSQIGIYNGKQIRPTFVDSSWNHVVLSYDGKNIQAFLNGTMYDTSMGSSAFLNTFNLLNTSLVLGQKQSGEKFFNGNIDELRIYNRALSDSEIQTLYNATK